MEQCERPGSQVDTCFLMTLTTSFCFTVCGSGLHLYPPPTPSSTGQQGLAPEPIWEISNKIYIFLNNFFIFKRLFSFPFDIFKTFYLCVWVFFLRVFLCIMCISGTLGDQKRTLCWSYTQLWATMGPLERAASTNYWSISSSTTPIPLHTPLSCL